MVLPPEMADAPVNAKGQNAAGAGNLDESRPAEPETVDVKCVLLDIEGTICPISFVKETLFPYALKALPDVLASKWNDEDFKTYRDAFPEEARTSPETLQAYVEKLTKEDRKDACHKNLQGYLWENGYKTGAYATPLFPDVAPRLKQWKDAGLTLAIYSSGSVFAQKLLFGHVRVSSDPLTGKVEQDAISGAKEPTVGEKRNIDDATGAGTASEQPPSKKLATDAGHADGLGGTAPSENGAAATNSVTTEDLRYLISDWFDTTNAGSKKESRSYRKIADALGLEPLEILFLTDSVEEYDASTTAYYKAGLMMRPGNPPVHRREDVNRFKMMYSLQNANPLRENYGIKERVRPQ